MSACVCSKDVRLFCVEYTAHFRFSLLTVPPEFTRLKRLKQKAERDLGWLSHTFLPARRHASAGTSYDPVSVSASVCLSVYHKSVFYRNGWTDRAGLWRAGFYRPILHCVLRKFRYLQKDGYFPLELCPKLHFLQFYLIRLAITPRKDDRLRHSLQANSASSPMRDLLTYSLCVLYRSLTTEGLRLVLHCCCEH